MMTVAGSRANVVSSFTIIKGSLIEETWEAFRCWDLDASKQENLQRSRVKRLIAELSKDHPAVPGNLLNSLRHVVPTHLLDPTVKRVAGTESAEE